MATNGKALETISSVTNEGAEAIATGQPYSVEVTIRGTAAILMHRWNDDAVQEKKDAKKNSAAKKSDNVESYVYRDGEGHICIPGPYLIGSMTSKTNGAAKYRQDPRSPRKSALDLYKAGVVALTDLAPIIPAKGTGPTKDWDYLDRRRVVIQQNGITRIRPAFMAGWKASIQLLVIAPEYISPADLHSCLSDGGRLVGIGDFRPTFGRFQIDSFDIGFAE